MNNGETIAITEILFDISFSDEFQRMVIYNKLKSEFE